MAKACGVGERVSEGDGKSSDDQSASSGICHADGTEDAGVVAPAPAAEMVTIVHSSSIDADINPDNTARHRQRRG